ncbi:MAG: tRNA (adenosine(37)-N6)-threonylcarbamoyltransferase complex dimerization subunit type 1 TsaB [Planctomycetota bacterium]
MRRIAVALETSARAASVAVRSGERSLELALELGRAHASDLLPAVDRMVRDLDGSPREIALVLVGTGPGSYTGLRVGIATALGLVRGCGAVIRGVPSGETLCFGELEPGEQASVLLDARAGEVYFAHYRRLAGDVEVLSEPCVLRPEEVPGILPRAGPIFADSGAVTALGLSEEARERVRLDVAPRASALLALGIARVERSGGQDPREVKPLYLRAFAVKARKR